MTALTEAKDSLAKASTPEPFSTSKTSNWIARAGGLPPYVQHIAHDLVEKRGKTESQAIQMALGIVKNWCSGQGKVDKNTRAAACKAVGQWEKLKAKNKAKGAVREAREFDALLTELDGVAENSRYRLSLAEGLTATLSDGSAGLRAHDRACVSAGALLGERPRDRAHALELLHEASLWDRIALIGTEPKPRVDKGTRAMTADDLAEAVVGYLLEQGDDDDSSGDLVTDLRDLLDDLTGDSEGDADALDASDPADKLTIAQRLADILSDVVGDDEGDEATPDAEAQEADSSGDCEALVAKFKKKGMSDAAARKFAKNLTKRKKKAQEALAEALREGNWIDGAIKRPGQLHKDLGVAEGKKIPVAQIRSAAKGHKDPKVRARARLALKLRGLSESDAPGVASAPVPFPDELSEFLGPFEEAKHPRLHGKFARKIGALGPGQTAHLGHGVHVQAPSSPGGTFTVKLAHSAPGQPHEMALARDASHAAAVAVHARRHRTLRGAGSTLREAFHYVDFRAELHPRDRLGKFRDVPNLPSLPGDRGGSITSVSRPPHINSPALGAQHVPHSPGRPPLGPLNSPGLTPTDIELGVNHLEHRSGASREIAGHTVTALPDGRYRVGGPDGGPHSRFPTASAAAQHIINARSPGRPPDLSQGAAVRRMMADGAPARPRSEVGYPPPMRNAHEVHSAFANGMQGQSGSVKSVSLGNGHHVLYSYGTPVAYRRPSGEVVYDPRKYSVTTSKQVSQNRGEVPANLQSDAASHEEFRAAVRDLGADVSTARSPGRPVPNAHEAFGANAKVVARGDRSTTYEFPSGNRWEVWNGPSAIAKRVNPDGSYDESTRFGGYGYPYQLHPALLDREGIDYDRERLQRQADRNARLGRLPQSPGRPGFEGFRQAAARQPDYAERIRGANVVTSGGYSDVRDANGQNITGRAHSTPMDAFDELASLRRESERIDRARQRAASRTARSPGRPGGTDPAEWDAHIRAAGSFAESQSRMEAARRAGVDFGAMNAARERSGDHLPGSAHAGAMSDEELANAERTPEVRAEILRRTEADEGPGGLFDPRLESALEPIATYSEGPNGEDFNDKYLAPTITVMRGANQGGNRSLRIEVDNGHHVLVGPESNSPSASEAILHDFGPAVPGEPTQRTLSKDERQVTFGSELPEAIDLPNGNRVEVYHRAGTWVASRTGAGGGREVVANGEVATQRRAPRPPKKSDSRTGPRVAQAHAATLTRAAQNYDLVELTLHSGGHTHGNVVSVEGDGVHMEGGDGQEIVVPLHRIKAVEKIDV